MSAEYLELTFSFTVKEHDKLPDGLYPEDVSRKIDRVMWDALHAWYLSRANDRYFATEPDFAMSYDQYYGVQV